ncbi:membrane protein [Bacillus phage YungSlug]|nr:membrane protein [Bacillus phage YungSlug]
MEQRTLRKDIKRLGTYLEQKYSGEITWKFSPKRVCQVIATIGFVALVVATVYDVSTNLNERIDAYYYKYDKETPGYQEKHGIKE